MKRPAFIIYFLIFIINTSISQSKNNYKLIGKWIIYKTIDSTDLGDISLECLDSFKVSVREIAKKNIHSLKGYLLDTIKNEERRYKKFENFLTPIYELFHGSWIEFCNNSTLIEHTNTGMDGKADNLFRTYEYDAFSKKLIMDKHGMSETLRVYMISKDEMILSFYSEGLAFLLKRMR
jgi:hypothetical protein